MINNAFDLWLSSENISKGSRSKLEIAKALAAAKAGIICLTPNNLTAPWILFEAGGIAKTMDDTLVCTVLIGLEWSDVSGGPLSEFQHTTKLDEKEMLKMVQDLNNVAGASARTASEIERAFKLCWPELKEKLKLEKLPSDGPTQRPERHTQDMLGESIDLARRHSAEIEAANIRMDEYIERNAAVFQSQIDYLTNILTPASSLSPTWQDAATSGMLSAHDGSSAATPHSVYGRVPLSQRGTIAKPSRPPTGWVPTTVSDEEAERAHAVHLNKIEDDKPEGGPEKK